MTTLTPASRIGLRELPLVGKFSARTAPSQAHRLYGTVTARIPMRALMAAPIALGAAAFPSYLPHLPVSLGVVLALAWIAAYALSGRVLDWTRTHAGRHLGRRARHLAVVSGLLLTVLVTLGSLQVQNAMRSRIGMSSLGITDLVTAGATAAAMIGLAAGTRWVWRRRARWWHAATALCVAGVLSGATAPADQTVSAAASAQEQVLRQAPTHGAVRAYADLVEEPDVTSRATLAVDRLVRDGGLTRRHVVIAVPTGSGWVDPHLVTGLEQRFGRQVATVAMQYDDRPSWLSYLLGKKDAEAGARALFDAVTGEIDRLPADQRPQLHIVGESLGATAGQAIFRGKQAPAHRARVCSTMWVGTPGGHGIGAPREVLIANSDDPIVHARPSMLVTPTGDGRPWLPVVSGVQAATDYLGALAVPTGSGHRYGPEQADELPVCPRAHSASQRSSNIRVFPRVFGLIRSRLRNSATPSS